MLPYLILLIFEGAKKYICLVNIYRINLLRKIKKKLRLIKIKISYLKYRLNKKCDIFFIYVTFNYTQTFSQRIYHFSMPSFLFFHQSYYIFIIS